MNTARHNLPREGMLVISWQDNARLYPSLLVRFTLLEEGDLPS